MSAFQQVSATDLAVRVHRSGDLYPGLDGRTQAEEGIQTQRTLQARQPANYQTEIAVSGLFAYAGLSLKVQGRVDGGVLDQPQTLLEEYKTTRADPDRAHQHLGDEHWAQLKIYAALLALAEPAREDFRLCLLYCHPDTLQSRCFEATPSRRELLDWFYATLVEYARWLLAQQAYATARDTWLGERGFPFAQYRPSQRAIAACVYRAVVQAEPLLLEAPTGSGKSLAVLYPALKGLAASGVDRFLFLTSRSTGAMAATQALKLIDPEVTGLRWVVLRAKQSVCPVPGMPCRADQCEYAAGYFDRIKGAVSDALERRALDLDTLSEVAEVHKVCPFELSLDAALECDVVIADYNYVLDPVARLLRFASGKGLGLLIDEAHQVFPRTTDMLSEKLSRSVIQAAISEAPPEPLFGSLRSLDRGLLKVTKAFRDQGDQTLAFIEFPAAVQRGLERFMDALTKLELNLADYPLTREVLFAGTRWLRILEHYSEETHRSIVSQEGRDLSVGYLCLDASVYIGKTLGRFGTDIRFSGTLSPLPLYRDLQGVPDTRIERAGSPFDPQQLATFVVPDIPTYYRQRSQSLPALAALLAQCVESQPGRYLVALPSFAYLNQLWDWCQANPLSGSVVMLKQDNQMSPADQDQFLTDFGRANQALAFVVLGGRFAESVDFADTQIHGVICVGVGIAPPGPAQQERLRYFDSKAMASQQIVLHQPAMVKIVQMAGRLIRAPEDRGVLCLVDNRFEDVAYRQFFPALWQPQRVTKQNLPKALADFWYGD